MPKAIFYLYTWSSLMDKKQQEKYNDWILENVQDGKTEEFKILLAEHYSKMSAGTQTPEYMISFSQKMISMLKPEFAEKLGQNNEI